VEKQNYIIVNGEKVPVTEEVYRAYMRPAWAEHKRQERWSRCRKPDGSRCEADCGKCPNRRTGGILSLDQSREEGFEPQDPTADVADIVANKQLLKQLLRLLDEMDPDSRRICELLGQGASEREIAAVFGIRQSTLNYRKNKILAQLRERLKDSI